MFTAAVRGVLGFVVGVVLSFSSPAFDVHWFKLRGRSGRNRWRMPIRVEMVRSVLVFVRSMMKGVLIA